MADYREAPLATRPKTLDPNEYFNLSADHRRAEESRAALRASLKRQYQTQLNNPHRKELIDLQHVLERFAAECEAAGMRISTSKSEAMVLDRKRVACPLRVGGEVLPQVEEFKYLGVLFTSEGKMEREIDRRIGAASAGGVPGVSHREKARGRPRTRWRDYVYLSRLAWERLGIPPEELEEVSGEDPALTRWVYARANPYTYFKPTFKTSLMGAMFGVVPLFVLYFALKTDRDRKEEQIKAGTLERKFRLSS
ncbi:hypothetical protein L3Q82_018065 [Scortum barcoo]|uniref:Uncharacterized protein n=1 Tax=Scortum barcoo TaxID=214431 RepID=A0ACB8VI19_9TELE|nr:hypothetical protein L3Q82_018065 [Scortum barcoo]